MRAVALAALAPAFALGEASPPPVTVEIDRPDREVSRRAQHSRAHTKARKASALALRARSIDIKAGWAERIALPLAVCDVLTTEKISAAMNAIEAAIAQSRAKSPLRAQSEGEIEVLLIDVDYDTGPGSGSECGGAPTVGVVFNPYHLRLSLERVGDNVLPVPRSPFALPHDKLPAPLAALQPRIGASHDRSFGTSLDAQLAAGFKDLEANAKVRKSVDASFHEADAGLRYRARLSGPLAREFRLRAGAEGSEEPLAGAQNVRRAAEMGLGLTLNLGPATPLLLDSAWRRSRDRVSATQSAAASDDATASLVNRALLDTLISATRGFLRASVWQDSARVDGTEASFHRLVARAGYAQEIRLAPNQGLGLEVIAGAGKLWRDAPASSRFYGGSSPVQFLYDAPASQQMLDMPRGPLIRSLGQGQAGLGDETARRGGTSFWHLNFNLALPIRAWSRPLIPDEEAFTDPEGRPVTLKQILRTAVDVTGPSLMEQSLKDQGLSEGEARRQAQTALQQIRPAVHYIVDDANVYAVRPLLMLDAAGLSGGANGTSAEWVAMGAGLSLTVVTARFEAGYMRTISGPELEGRNGSVFFRLVFHRLF